MEVRRPTGGALATASTPFVPRPPQRLRRLQVRHRRHAVVMHLAALVDRNILPDDETFVGEMKADVVGQSGFAVIVETLGATCVIDEMAELVCFVGTLPRDPAGLAMRPPKSRIDATLSIDRCDEDVGNFVVANGVTGLAGQYDTNLPELRRRRRSGSAFAEAWTCRSHSLGGER